MRKRSGDSWELSVTLGTDFTGKRKRFYKTVHCKTERAASKELARFVTECEDGFYNQSKPMTVKQLCNIYEQHYVKRHQKKNAQLSFESISKKWIIPFLGSRKVAKLKKFDVQEWVDMIEDKGKSPKTIRNIHSVLRSMLKYAITDLEIITDNPCAKTVLPPVEKKESKSYNADDVKKILKAFQDIPPQEQALKCFVLLAIFGGFRKGEILGFDWPDIDFENHKICVSKTRYRDNEKDNRVYIDTPKSTKSNRTIALPDFIFDELKKLDIQQKKEKLLFGPAYADEPAVIRLENGTVMNPDKPYKWFKKICEVNDIPFYGIHALRHTHASLLAEIGANYVHVSKRMGHAQVSTTLNIYTHLFKNADDNFADQLNSFVTDEKMV